MHSVLFVCLTKLGANLAEQVQKFVPRSCNRIFHNECTRSTPLDSGPFGCLTKLGAKWAELVPKFVLGCHVGIFRNEHTRSSLLDPKLTFWCVSHYLGAFGTVWLPYESRSKTDRISAKVRATSRVGIFRNERTRSTPLDPKMTFWCVSYYLGAFSQRTYPIYPVRP